MAGNRALVAAELLLRRDQRRGARADRGDVLPGVLEGDDHFEHRGRGAEGAGARGAARQDQDVVGFVGGLVREGEEGREVGEEADVAG